MRTISLVPLATLVLWLGCLAVGVAGLKLPYPRARPPAKRPEPVVARLINVQVTEDRTRAEPGPSRASDAGPTRPPTPPPPALPPLPAVAAPSPAIAFAVPVEGPTRIVEPRQAAPARLAPATTPSTRLAAAPPAAPAPAAAQNTPQKLTFGEGEGKQPLPEYPREAVIAKQEGTVVVRFTVGDSGRVVKAEASTPCAYPLLNQAAVRAVRETWRLPPGIYEVPIQFELER